MKVLVACEESQRVCIEFRKLGHEAYSCDVIEPSGGHPEWHIKGDALKIINPAVHENHYEGFGGFSGIRFYTMDGEEHEFSGKWDLIIAHPPCTYLTNVATRSFSLRVTPAEKVVKRWEERAKAVAFFMQLALANCDRIAVENPVGFMTKAYRKPDQYISPWMFATGVDDTENYFSKKTGLWLKGLPKLHGNGIIKNFSSEIYGKYSNGKNRTWEDIVHGADVRSKTFPGIARAMAAQWGGILTEKDGGRTEKGHGSKRGPDQKGVRIKKDVASGKFRSQHAAGTAAAPERE